MKAFILLTSLLLSTSSIFAEDKVENVTASELTENAEEKVKKEEKSVLGRLVDKAKSAINPFAKKEDDDEEPFEATKHGSEANKFIGLSAILQNFNGINGEVIEYDVDSNLWTSVQGSYKLTKKLGASLGANFDTKQADQTFQFIGSISTDNLIFGVTTGKLTGDAVVNGTIKETNTSFQNRADNFESKYLSIDILFKNWKLIDDTLMGFRYTQYEIPAEIEARSIFGTQGTINFDETVQYLDPNLKIKALQYTFRADSQRKFVRLGKTGKFTHFENGMYSGGGLGLTGGGAWGIGIAEISDAGKANVTNSSGGKILSDDSDLLILLETNIGLQYEYNWVKNNARYSVAVGYQGAHVTILSFSGLGSIEEPENDTTADLESINFGHVFHGPKISFYASW